MKNDIFSITGYVLGIGGAIVVLFSRTKNDNIADLKDRVSILEKERENAREQHIENQKAIANLEGQLATYKEIPLKSIAESLEKLTESNTAILDTLKGSAQIAKTAQSDGGMLVKTRVDNPLDVKPIKEKK